MQVTLSHGTIFKAHENSGVESKKPGLSEALNSFIEYPGSKEHHEWFVEKWLESKVGKLIENREKGGTERK
jgi:hypothetical protein